MGQYSSRDEFNKLDFVNGYVQRRLVDQTRNNLDAVKDGVWLVAGADCINEQDWMDNTRLFDFQPNDPVIQ